MDSDTNRQWAGPTSHALTALRAIVLKAGFRAGFLDTSDPNQGFFAKNHLVSFTEPVQIGGMNESAQISRKLGPWMEVDANPVHERGRVHIPGVSSAGLLTYRDPSHRSLQHRTFRMKYGVTIGEVLNTAIRRNMHHFLFLPCTVEGRWKGCGDFFLIFPDWSCGRSTSAPASSFATSPRRT